MSQVFSAFVAFVFILLATFHPSSHASVQITLETDFQFLLSQNSLAVDVNYINDKQDTGSMLELNIFFDSNQLHLSQIQAVDNRFQPLQSVLPDLNNLDNDPTTGKYINISVPEFVQPMPEAPLSTRLLRLTFDVKDNFHGAFIHATSKPISLNEPLVFHSVYVSQQ
jgi:hypothetical protein